MMKAFSLPNPKFVFAGGKTHSDKLRGLRELGPFQPVEKNNPRFAFLFRPNTEIGQIHCTWP